MSTQRLKGEFYEYIELSKKGFSDVDIAKIMNITPEYIYERKRVLRITRA